MYMNILVIEYLLATVPAAGLILEAPEVCAKV